MAKASARMGEYFLKNIIHSNVNERKFLNLIIQTLAIIRKSKK
jgi:hypothetical protein